MIRTLLASCSALALACASVSEAFPQSRTTLSNLNNSTITTNGQQQISGAKLNTLLNLMITGSGNVTDTNAWTGTNTFATPIGTASGGTGANNVFSARRNLGSPLTGYDYQPICTGVSHPLSGTYATLAAAQVVYPAALALTDETDWAAISSYIAAYRAILTGNQFANAGRFDLTAVGITHSSNCLLNRALDVTNFRGYGAVLDFAGTALYCTMVGGICVDNAMNEFAVIKNLDIRSTSGGGLPDIGLYSGRSGTNNRANGVTYENLHVVGYFAVAAVDNFGGEVNHYITPVVTNQQPNAISFAADGLNSLLSTAVPPLPITSPFVGNTAPPNTFVSFDNLQVTGGTIEANGAGGIPIYLAATNGATFENVYTAVTGGPLSTATNYEFYSFLPGDENQGTTINSHMEGGTIGAAAVAQFTGPNPTQNIMNLIYRDHGFGALTNIFKTDNGSSFVGGISGDTLTVASIVSGTLFPTRTLTGAGVTSGTMIASQLSGPQGGAGIYNVVTGSQTVQNFTTMTGTGGPGASTFLAGIAGNILSVSSVSVGAPGPGTAISGVGVTGGTRIVAQLNGIIGGVGKYAVTTGTQTVTAGTSITGSGTVSVALPGLFFRIGNIHNGEGVFDQPSLYTVTGLFDLGNAANGLGWNLSANQWTGMLEWSGGSKLQGTGSFQPYGILDSFGDANTINMSPGGQISGFSNGAFTSGYGANPTGVYTFPNTLKISPPDVLGGAQATGHAVSWGLFSAPQLAQFCDPVLGCQAWPIGGTGYSTNDILTVPGGTCSVQPQIRITSVDGGGVPLSWVKSTVGACTVAMAMPANLTGGTGTGGTIGRIAWTPVSYAVDTAGSGYTNPTVQVNAGTYDNADATSIVAAISNSNLIVTSSVGSACTNVSLGATYTIPPNIGCVRFTQGGTVATSTVTLPTVNTDSQPLRIVTYGAVTAFTLSPSVAGWTNGSTFSANSSISLLGDISGPAWHKF